MKAIGLIVALLGLVQGLRDRSCELSPFVQGTCFELTMLYSYMADRNECVFWHGCLLDGNHFTNKEDCEAKCKI
ncbi:uncharacterized protein LOC108134707 [Drosophila elegans]|uniref:uncharacterized protein LOC108134707 n=1 Tax=Drosophila elegans TaxID=30023 RepID=UPI0007E74BDC|nr:uncharacterized protein LOC108134707 [Drosophila elegans]